MGMVDGWVEENINRAFINIHQLLQQTHIDSKRKDLCNKFASKYRVLGGYSFMNVHVGFLSITSSRVPSKYVKVRENLLI